MRTTVVFAFAGLGLLSLALGSEFKGDTEKDRARITAWKRANPGPLVLRIALPPGPGATIVWGQVGAALIRIGVTPQRVGLGDPADLRLVDAVAPYDSARWYLVTACRPCSRSVVELIEGARNAATLPERARFIAQADAALTGDYAYVPIAQPFRWSIVTSRVTGWQGNARAWHPLNHLRNEGE